AWVGNGSAKNSRAIGSTSRCGTDAPSVAVIGTSRGLILSIRAACHLLPNSFAAMIWEMSSQPLPRKPRRPRPVDPANATDGPLLDLNRYVPAFITFIGNKLSNSATAFYQKNFGVNVTEWRIISQLAIEPGIPASRICQVIGF